MKTLPLKDDYNKLILPQSLKIVAQIVTQALNPDFTANKYGTFLFSSKLDLSPLTLNQSELDHIYSDRI
jgi:hypothetical protein